MRVGGPVACKAQSVVRLQSAPIRLQHMRYPGPIPGPPEIMVSDYDSARLATCFADGRGDVRAKRDQLPAYSLQQRGCNIRDATAPYRASQKSGSAPERLYPGRQRLPRDRQQSLWREAVIFIGDEVRILGLGRGWEGRGDLCARMAR